MILKPWKADAWNLGEEEAGGLLRTSTLRCMVMCMVSR